MVRKSWLATVLTCATIAGVMAHTETTVTVTGCVQNISSTTPAGQTTHGFLLANATLPDTAADAGTRGRPPAKATLSFLLDGHGDELKSEVGHKVEITGTVDVPIEAPSEP